MPAERDASRVTVRRLYGVIGILIVVNLACLLHAQSSFYVPMATPEFAQRRAEYESHAGKHWDLSEVVGLHIRDVRTAGSDQNHEIDTFVHHGADTVAVTSGIDLLLVEAGGRARYAKTSSFGGAIEGQVDQWDMAIASPQVGPNGSVGQARAFVADFSHAQGAAHESFVDPDHRSVHTLAGTTREIDVLAFSNGWSLRVNGDSLELWDARGVVHILR